jgi:hypothetical protein
MSIPSSALKIEIEERKMRKKTFLSIVFNLMKSKIVILTIQMIKNQVEEYA